MDSKKRSAARIKGLTLAARIATVGGITAFALGVVEVRPARASATATATDDTTHEIAASDDITPLPMEGAVMKSGNCGCSPCWGPPAPPSKSDPAAAARGLA